MFIDFNMFHYTFFQGADFSAQNADGRTALHLACALGDVRIVRYLLLNGSSVHIKDK